LLENAEMISNEQLAALGKLLAAHSWLNSTTIGILGRLLDGNQGEAVLALVNFHKPVDRVLLSLRLLETNALRFGISTGVYQNLENALRQALAWVSVDLSVNEVEVDIESWLENEAEPWQAVSLTTDIVELEKSADLVFSLGGLLLKGLAGYVAERNALTTEVNRAPS
jgi:hypothetical protein